MKKGVVAVIISFFLIGFAMATLTTQAISDNYNSPAINNSHLTSSVNNTNDSDKNNSINDHNQTNETRKSENKLTDEQIKKIIIARNRILAEILGKITCPNKCTCEGKVVRCFLGNGTREMTIVAGNSGNVIVQVKGINASTNVTLYKADDGKVYGVFKNNETRVVKMLPDQVQEKIRERFARQLENENITLNENGTYDYSGEKNATLLFFFHVKEKVNAKVDSQTGEITNIKNPWWSFMAKDEGQQLVGASCGTVTPGQNDLCCQNKQYDFWNATAAECQFNSSN